MMDETNIVEPITVRSVILPKGGRIQQQLFPIRSIEAVHLMPRQRHHSVIKEDIVAGVAVKQCFFIRDTPEGALINIRLKIAVGDPKVRHPGASYRCPQPPFFLRKDRNMVFYHFDAQGAMPHLDEELIFPFTQAALRKVDLVVIADPNFCGGKLKKGL